MKKTLKVLYIALCILAILSPVIFADTVGNIEISPNVNQNQTSAIGNSIVGIIKVVGVFVAVGALMVIGIKYMMGSAEEKAEYKKVMIPYIIGAVLLFAAALFADKLAAFANNLFSK